MLTEPSASGRGRGAERPFGFPIGTADGWYAVSALLAIGIHAGILFCLPKSRHIEPAEYGVVQGERATEVTLVAAQPMSEEKEIESSQAVESSEPVESSEAIDELKEESAPDEAAPETSTLREMPKPEPMQDAKPLATPARVLPSSKLQMPAARKGASSDGRNPARSGSRSPSIDATSGSLTSKPAYLHNPHPPYPEISRKAGHTGVVILRVSISESGRVAAVRLIKSSGYSLLDDRARTTVQRWVFRPARSDGRPVATQVDVPVRFSLDR